jgi:hypothetical protein
MRTGTSALIAIMLSLGLASTALAQGAGGGGAGGVALGAAERRGQAAAPPGRVWGMLGGLYCQVRASTRPRERS